MLTYVVDRNGNQSYVYGETDTFVEWNRLVSALRVHGTKMFTSTIDEALLLNDLGVSNSTMYEDTNDIKNVNRKLNNRKVMPICWYGFYAYGKRV